MGATDVLKNLGNKALTNLTGRTELAYLLVVDNSKGMEGVPAMEDGGVTKETMKRLRKGSKEDGLDLDAFLAGPEGLKIAKTIGKKLRIPVQFNPSELVINAYDPGVVTRQDMTGQDGQETASTSTSVNSLTVQLYFDDMRVPDAFMQEKFDMSLLGMGKNAAANLIDLGTKRGEHTVQPQVEGLMALLRNRGCREVSFCWNDFMFSGILDMVQATYTMFNTLGAPVRAKVVLQITQECSAAQQKAWREAMLAGFGQDDHELDARRGQDMVGSMINLNL